jgi:hypothetical protein
MNEDETDLPHPPIVAFPSTQNQFQMDLGTEDTIILILMKPLVVLIVKHHCNEYADKTKQ